MMLKILDQYKVSTTTVILLRQMCEYYCVPAQSPGIHGSRGSEKDGMLCTQCQTLGFQVW